MRILSRGLQSWLVVLLVLCLGVMRGLAAPPDLTAGGVPNDTLTSNLGPTGMRGWIYHTIVDTGESRQIKVTQVLAGSPAASVMAVNDVILGADGTGAEPVYFSSDARRQLALAIADAEARTPATLKLIRWRAGVVATVQLSLRTMGAYSATAPYNCPKSAKILEEGLQYIMASETAGLYSFGTLSLLAGNDPSNPNNVARQARARTEALALIPGAGVMAMMNSTAVENSGRPPWVRGHSLIVLAEYYLQTGDAQVIPAIEAHVRSITNGQSLFGTMGHIYASKWPDGSANGPMGGGYGAVNSSAVPCFYGLLLAKQCGISMPELDAGIERASRFFAYFADKGAIPYGEHEPGTADHESNGKCGLAALCFDLQTNRVPEGKFYTRMALAATSEREVGHTGAYFNYLWSPLGAAAGGEAAAASYFARTSWMYDLCRRWDGAFVYDCLYGQGPANGATYNDFRMSTAALLTYALPLKKLHCTGRGHDISRVMALGDISAAEAADGYKPTLRTTSELMSDLGSWSPIVQRSAATQLATRTTETTALLPTLTAMATDPQGTSRIGACYALGKIANSGSAPVLAGLLTDPANHVRFTAAEALRYLPQSAKLAQLNTIMSATVSTARPLFPLVEEDPMQMAHGRLPMLLFYSGSAYGPKGVIWNDLTGVDRNLLLPAIRATAYTPVGQSRSTVASAYSLLTESEMNVVADAVVESVADRSPADRMFGSGARKGGIDLMERFNNAEGVPLSKIYLNDDISDAGIILDVLKRYAGSSKTVIPNPDVVAYSQQLIVKGVEPVKAQQVIDAINADTNPAVAIPFKSIQSVTADAASLTLPVKSTTLRVSATDHAQGASIYTWRKVYGVGNVTFSPNGTSGSNNTSLFFDGAAGNYLFEVKMSDSRGLTEVFSTVPVTLYQSNGTLPPNTPPVANAQSLSVNRGLPTPITLSGTDPEGHALGFAVTSGPTQGSLTGTAPYLIYTSAFDYTGSDSVTFRVTDSGGQTSTATVNITVNAPAAVGVGIYEPFDYISDILNGESGLTEVGVTGTWSANASAKLVPTSLTYGALPVLGGSVGNLNGGSNNYGGTRLISTAALSGNGLLTDGATLWFSVVVGYGGTANTTNARLGFAFANSGFNTGNYQYYIANEGGQLGSGVGLTLGRFSANGKVVATHFRDSTFGTGVTGNVFGNEHVSTLAAGQQRLVVGKITWGATSDKIELYEPDVNMNLGSVTSTLTVNVNQSTFDAITWARGDSVTMDEIRFGPTYNSVLMGSTGMVADTTAPNPVSFAVPPVASSTSTITMEATGAYDPSGVEYYFTCTAGGGHDSAWQDGRTYTDTGLTPGVSYSYTVKARDKSPARNSTTPSTAASATISTQQTVPAVVGLQQSAAGPVIVWAGLTVGTVTTQNHATIPAGAVISQNPAANALVATNSAVNLVVSLGPVMTTVPNVVGLTQATAQSNIGTATLVVGTVTSQYHTSVPAGVVISQNPSGGASVPINTNVNMVVSLGPDTVAPTLSATDIVDDKGGAAVLASTAVIYTVTFNEDINGASVSAVDFSNAGSSTISIGSVTEISPGVVSVRVTPTTMGTLRLQVSAGAVITDLFGNALNTTSAVMDDTTITVNGNGGSLALIRDTFNMTTGTLNGKAGGAGISGNWTRTIGDATNDLLVESPGQSYGILPAFGNSIATAPAGGGRIYRATLNSALSDAGLLQDGTTLWFSMLVRPVVGANARLYMQLANGNCDTNGVIAGGDGIGISVFNGSDLQTWANKVGVTSTTTAQADLHNIGGTNLGFRTHLVVGKITWGVGAANDTVQIYLPDANLVMGTQKGTTLSVAVNQTTFNRLSIGTLTADGVDFDDIRFGANYDAVIGKTTVPNLIGLGQTDAQTAIVSANLVVGTVTTQVSTTIPEGVVISQSVASGTVLLEGNTVNLVVSSGGAPVPVPDVVGMTQANAQNTITTAGLTVGLVSMQNDLVVPAGQVISQSPLGGTTAPPTSAVNLVVSLGPLFIDVPNIVGLAQTPAQNTIIMSGLTVGAVTSQNSATVPAGDIISQSPSAGISVVEGTAVGFVLSLGPVMVTVPNVVGQSQSSAEATLAAANLVVGSVIGQNSATVPVGNVMSQSPGNGTSVEESSFVDLVVSIGPLSILNYATSDSAVLGKLGGTYVNTHSSDGVYEQITEAVTGGNPSTKQSSLEHKWVFNVSASTSPITFYAEAHHTANTEGDDFTFAYSTTGLNGTYVNMLVVTKTSDNNTPQTFELPLGVSGTVHVRVLDNNRTAGNKVADVLYVDDMHFQSVLPDTTVPTLTSASIVDDKSGATVVANTVVTYTLTFSEDIDASTVSAEDFGNAGTATHTFGAITETTPTSGVFTVAVTPTGGGTLQLRVNAGAVIKDAAANNLDTASAIVDNTTLSVQTPYNDWSNSASFTEDANNDGVPNGVAWLLGAASPTANARLLLPTPDVSDANYLIYSYRRSDTAAPNVSATVSYSTTLTGWTTALHDGSSVIITASNDFYGEGIDKVEVKISRSLAPTGKLFMRLNVQGLP